MEIQVNKNLTNHDANTKYFPNMTHNWGDSIKVDLEDVLDYLAMGKAIKFGIQTNSKAENENESVDYAYGMYIDIDDIGEDDYNTVITDPLSRYAFLIHHSGSSHPDIFPASIHLLFQFDRRLEGWEAVTRISRKLYSYYKVLLPNLKKGKVDTQCFNANRFSYGNTNLTKDGYVIYQSEHKINVDEIEQIEDDLPNTNANTKTNNTRNKTTRVLGEDENTSSLAIMHKAIANDIHYPKDLDIVELFDWYLSDLYDQDGMVKALKDGDRWSISEAGFTKDSRKTCTHYKGSNVISITNKSGTSASISDLFVDIYGAPSYLSENIPYLPLQLRIAIKNIRDGEQFDKDIKNIDRLLVETKEVCNRMYGGDNDLFNSIQQNVQCFREQCLHRDSILQHRNDLDLSSIPVGVQEKYFSKIEITSLEWQQLYSVYKEQMRTIALKELGRGNIEKTNQIYNISELLKGETAYQVVTENIDILAGTNLIRVVNDVLYIYKNGYWQETPKIQIEQRMSNILKYHKFAYRTAKGEPRYKCFFETNTQMEGAFKAFYRAITVDESDVRQVSGLNFADCSVIFVGDRGRWKITPHNPDYNFTNIMPCNYPKPETKEERQALRKLMNELTQTISDQVHKRNFLMTLTYILNPSLFNEKYGFPRCIIIKETTGRNGKDTTRQLTEKLIGSNKMGCCGLEEYAATDGFDRGELINKLVNWSSENLSKNILLTKLKDLKADITHDKRTFNRKHLRPIQDAKFEGLSVHCSNETIVVNNGDDHIVERFAFIEFDGVYKSPEKYDANNPNHFLKDHRYKDDENFIDKVVLPAYARLLLHIYWLMHTDQISFDWSYVDTEFNQLLSDSSHFVRFLHHGLDSNWFVKDEESKITLKQFHAIYMIYCEQEEYVSNVHVYISKNSHPIPVKALLERESISVVESLASYDKMSVDHPHFADKVALRTNEIGNHIKKIDWLSTEKSNRKEDKNTVYVCGLKIADQSKND